MSYFRGDVNRFLIMRNVPKKHETVVRLIPPTGSFEENLKFFLAIDLLWIVVANL